MEMSSEATRVDFVILGIGVNLNIERSELPEEFRDRATSLRSHVGHKIDRAAFVRQLFSCLEEVLDLHARKGFTALLPRYEARFSMQGQSVRVSEIGGSILLGTETEERRVGKECRSRWSPYHEKKKTQHRNHAGH